MIRFTVEDIHGTYDQIMAELAQFEIGKDLEEKILDIYDSDKRAKMEKILSTRTPTQKTYSTDDFFLPKPFIQTSSCMRSDGKEYTTKIALLTIENTTDILKKISDALSKKREIQQMGNGLVVLVDSKPEAVIQEEPNRIALYRGKNGANRMPIITKQEFTDEVIYTTRLLTDVVNAVCEKTDKDVTYSLRFSR